MTRSRVASLLFAASLSLTGALAPSAHGQTTQPADPLNRPAYPTPSLYRIAWELDFKHETPARISVDVPGVEGARAYWYVLYEVTNNSSAEQSFLPVFEIMTADGSVVRSDRNIPKAVFDRIKARVGRPMLEPAATIAGPLRVGPEQVKFGVAVWPAPEGRNGLFTVFVGGLSGEAVAVKGADGKPLMDAEDHPLWLRKTLKLDFTTRGDEFYASDDRVEQIGKTWVMR